MKACEAENICPVTEQQAVSFPVLIT